MTIRISVYDDSTDEHVEANFEDVTSYALVCAPGWKLVGEKRRGDVVKLRIKKTRE